nr:MAG TPA: Protein of unknown function (DUF3037) [Caudoviricetes sp.]
MSSKLSRLSHPNVLQFKIGKPAKERLKIGVLFCMPERK